MFCRLPAAPYSFFTVTTLIQVVFISSRVKEQGDFSSFQPALEAGEQVEPFLVSNRIRGKQRLSGFEGLRP